MPKQNINPPARPLRLIHLIHSLGSGGAENGIVNLVNHHDEHKFVTAICVFNGGGELTERVNRKKTEIFELDKKNGNDPSLIWKLIQLFSIWKPDIVHTHSWGTLCEGVIAAKISGIPVIVHGEHGTVQMKWHNRFIQKLFWNAVKKVLSVSDMHKRRLISDIGFPQGKIEVIYNGVDTNKFRKVKKPVNYEIIPGFIPKGIVISTIGRLMPVKNQAMLIDAFANVFAKYPDTVLLIAGDGPLKNDLQHQVHALKISEAVHFMGIRSDIDDVLRMSDIFVLPSKSEGMSNTILEAMSTSLPVVATRVGGNIELVIEGETGILIPSDNRLVLEQSLLYLIDHPLTRKKMGEAARKRISSNYSIHTMVKNYEKFYLKLV